MLRIKINFELAKGSQLPLNYQYPISSWIYKVIGQANTDFANWLHSKGYQQDHKQYRLFSFGSLFTHPFKIDKKNAYLIALSNKASLNLSFYGDESAQHFITGLFQNQEFGIGTKKHKAVDLKVSGLQILPHPTFSESMQYYCNSPINLSKGQENGPAQYLVPSAEDYERYFLQQISNKYLAVASYFPKQLGQLSFQNKMSWEKISDKTREKLITIKADSPAETKVKGYLYEFELQAPIPIQKLLYYGGFGEKTSQGFGMVEVKKNFETEKI